MSQVRILSPRPLIFMEFFWAGCVGFQMQNACGSRNGFQFQGRNTTRKFGCLWMSTDDMNRWATTRFLRLRGGTGAGARSESGSIDRSIVGRTESLRPAGCKTGSEMQCQSLSGRLHSRRLRCRHAELKEDWGYVAGKEHTSPVTARRAWAASTIAVNFGSFRSESRSGSAFA